MQPNRPHRNTSASAIPSKRCNRLQHDAPRQFPIVSFFCYISGFAATQQEQRSSSNNSSNAVTSR
jgi:hypothetical protein